MRYLVFFLFMFAGLAAHAGTSTIIIPDSNHHESVNKAIPASTGFLEQWLTMTPKEITRITGKKLTIKEKIALSIVRHKLKKVAAHADDHDKNKNLGKTALILGILSLVTLIIPFLDIASIPLAILAIILVSKAKRLDPHDKRARTAITLGIVTLGLFAFIVGLVIIILSSGTWFWG